MESLAMKALGSMINASETARLGSATVAIITKSAPGFLGKLGLNTTTVVKVPIAGVVAASVAVGYGVIKGATMAKKES